MPYLERRAVRYGKVAMVKLLPQKGETRAAFVDFVEIEDARVLAAAPSVSRAQTFMRKQLHHCDLSIPDSPSLKVRHEQVTES